MYSDEDKFKIWYLKPKEFNKWRKENDLKKLFKYIIEHSDSFVKWMDYFNLSLSDILEIIPTRDVFWGIKKIFIEKRDENSEKTIFLANLDSNQNKDELIRYFEFIPYFLWKKENMADKPFLINNKGKEYNTISLKNSGSYYNRKVSISSVEIDQVVLLFGEVRLLDIGDVKLASDFGLLNKNLDFLAMNNVTLYDSSHLFYGGLDIFCSSIKRLHLLNTTAHSFKISKCDCSKLKIENSIVTNLEIVDSYMSDNLYSLYIDRSKIDKFTLRNIKMNSFNVYDSEITGFKYIPQKIKGKIRHASKKYKVIHDNVKRLRISFESSGNHYKASEYYYWEKNLERKCFWYKVNVITPKSKYANTLRNIVKNFIKRNYSFNQSKKYFIWKSKYYFEILSKKRYRNQLILLYLNQVRLWIEWLVWGYGERPLRIVASSAFIIVISSFLYVHSNNIDLSGNIINSMYYSIITFTTLGYGDITPTSLFLKVISSLEALLGAFSMGLLIAGFVNKSK